MAVRGNNWTSQAAEFLGSLVIGDPLDPQTQVGYIESHCLDYLEELRHKYSSWAIFFGGQRLSPIQATPLLVDSQADLPEFFAQEIPAYILAIRQCQDLPEAIDQINRFTTEQPRLAVSLMNIPRDQLSEAVLNLCITTWSTGHHQPVTCLLKATITPPAMQARSLRSTFLSACHFIGNTSVG
jgi:acyl-CoA reductase-like NAD-dependent aldehyde dehydrogenase